MSDRVSGKEELCAKVSDVLAASDNERTNAPTARLSEVAAESDIVFAIDSDSETLSDVLAKSDRDSGTVNPPIELSDTATLSDSDSDTAPRFSVKESDVLTVSDRDS